MTIQTLVTLGVFAPLLGAMIGREEQAEAYNAFRASRLKTISDRVAGLRDEQKPTVFLEAHAGNGPDCCNSVGAGNIGERGFHLAVKFVARLR